LVEAGSPLVLRRGDSREVLAAVVSETGATELMWNRLYDAESVARDETIVSAMNKLGVKTASHNASLINEPDAVRTGAGGPFKVFTPFFRAALKTADVSAHADTAPRLEAPKHAVRSEDLTTWSLHPSAPDWSGGFGDWTPGEAGGRARLDRFLGDAATSYTHGRNLMGEEGVSRLSPHLHFGEIGPRQVWRAVRDAAEHGVIGHGEAETFQKELMWREFNYSLLFHNPQITHRPFNAAFAGFDWLDDEAGFRAWTMGQTGFPIVDAAMRQLWATGWMHNRARMIAASFLVKDLLVDWRRGEAWFWDTLVDADLANNVANWQWVAGSGADAAPFFRVFNPTLQGEKFDSLGLYVRRWVPELAGLGDKDIHQPWNADPAALRRAGVDLGSTYPCPIVDHATARDRALAAYARVS
jgi:deoxyribodipyrimidine photo-lyase